MKMDTTSDMNSDAAKMVSIFFNWYWWRN